MNSKENQTIIKALGMYGRVPEQWELLNEIERLNNIIYTTLEYVDREEINSTGKPYTYTERGKHIKELLEGERTFNSLWQENNRLNNIINKAIEYINRYLPNYDFDHSNLEKLLKILIGEDNE